MPFSGADCINVHPIWLGTVCIDSTKITTKRRYTDQRKLGYKQGRRQGGGQGPGPPMIPKFALQIQILIKFLYKFVWLAPPNNEKIAILPPPLAVTWQA